MTKKTVVSMAALLGAISVVIGALGAHALKDVLMTSGGSNAYELAVKYQFYHVFALLLTGLLMEHYSSKRLVYAVWFFLAGMILFSGSLYVLSLTTITAVGPLTPLGGVSLILGWIFLFSGVVKRNT